jgi:hypothetical protein
MNLANYRAFEFGELIIPVDKLGIPDGWEAVGVRLNKHPSYYAISLKRDLSKPATKAIANDGSAPGSHNTANMLARIEKLDQPASTD